MTMIRLAAAWNGVQSRAVTEARVDDVQASILVAYPYISSFMARREKQKMTYREWVLDSGAFSAWKSGVPVELDDYIAACQRLLATEPLLAEVFALDVIGDVAGTVENTRKMWDADVPAIPAFHYGEPWEYLFEYARSYPKIALGGTVGLPRNKRFAWTEQCFARIWPKKIHGFGVNDLKMLEAFPFHTVDATSWAAGELYGRWQGIGRHQRVRLYGIEQAAINLRVEAEGYLRLEARLRNRWGRELARLDEAKEEVGS